MKFLTLIIVFFASTAFADRGDDDHVKNCLKHWGETPFSAKKNGVVHVCMSL